MEIIVDDPAGVAKAYVKYYSEMAEHFASLIRPSVPTTILEAGGGKGQLTIPLLRRLPRFSKLMVIDSSRGPYSGWLEELDRRVRRTGLESRVKLIKADVRKMSSIKSGTIDLIVSNELLCDLPTPRMLHLALREFHRVLRPGGFMIHGEWASVSDGSKSFLAKHRPSWSPDQLFSAMQNVGFRDFQVTYFDTTIRFESEAAIEELRSWGASSSTITPSLRVLRRFGIKLPFEHIVRCRK